MPVDQIARAIQSRGDIAFAEETTLNDAVDGFEDIGRFEFERARSVEALDSLRLWHGEVEDGIVCVHRQRIGIGVEVRGNAREYHAPLLRLERIHISVSDGGRIDDDTLMYIVVNHLTLFEELRERQCWQALVGGWLMAEHGVQLSEARQLRSVKGIFGIYSIGYALRLRAADEHDAPVGWEENGRVELCDAIGIDADIARDGLASGE